jgi:hypothetical protein
MNDVSEREIRIPFEIVNITYKDVRVGVEERGLVDFLKFFFTTMVKKYFVDLHV